MKRILFINILATCMTAISFGQSFDWNLRGGLNLMNSKTTGEDLALLYHIGAQAGVRITNYGVYGELTYSMLEDQFGGGPLAYLAPAVLAKAYVLRFMFCEVGAILLSPIDDPASWIDDSNPDNEIFLFGGLGVHFSKIEISMRSIVKQSYAIVQLTAAVKF
ncbi:MAG: hypothetical protein R6W67_03140 [Bacteroidales bacterium]